MMHKPKILGIISKYRKKYLAFELLRYAQVGILLNTSTYLLYLLLTSLSMVPLSALFITYPVGYLAGFFAHKNHTFRFIVKSNVGHKIGIYIFIQLLGLVFNIICLNTFITLVGIPHQLAQLISLPLVACFLFVLMKTFVFNSNNT